MNTVSRRMSGVPASDIRALANAAWARPGTIHLEIGEPDFGAPPHVIEAALRAARNGAARYGPSAGLPGLRDAIVAKLERDNDLHVQRENILVAAGGLVFSMPRTARCSTWATSCSSQSESDIRHGLEALAAHVRPAAA